MGLYSFIVSRHSLSIFYHNRDHVCPICYTGAQIIKSYTSSQLIESHDMNGRSGKNHGQYKIDQVIYQLRGQDSVREEKCKTYYIKDVTRTLQNFTVNLHYYDIFQMH